MGTVSGKSEANTPTIVESYRDFHPPTNFRRNVETLLRYVPSEYLAGLATIILTNSSALTRDKRKQKVWSRNRKVRLAECLGSYSRASQSSPAAVWLYVDNIVKVESPWWEKVPLLRYAALADVLYHEIGHHIHSVHRPVYDGRENVAEDWSRKLWRRFCRKHYWYLLPFLHVFARAATPILKRLSRAQHVADRPAEE